MSSSIPSRSKGLTLRELVIFAMLGALTFCSDLLMDALPNIHLVGLFITTFTLVFRVKALLPLYVYVALSGISAVLYGGILWWVPYLYVWTVLFGIILLIPRRIPRSLVFILAHLFTTLHGLAYGTLYAPMQAVLFHLDFRGMLAWIAAGIPFDLLHAVGNFAFGFFIYPLTVLLEKLTYGKSQYEKHL